MWKHVILVVVVLSALVSGAVFAENTGFTTTWSNPPSVEGFVNKVGALSNPGEGGNPGGFLKCTRAGGVGIHLQPAPYLRDNWGELFGTDPGTISFDVKALDDYTLPQINFFFSDGGTSFRYIISTQKVLRHPQARADGWVRYSIPWQATWDTAQAKAKGWRPNRKTAKWSNVVNNPRYSWMAVTGAGKGAGDQAVGIDNFRVEAGKALDAASRALIEPPPPPQEKPVVHYAFDEGAGDVLHDRAGNAPDGKISGAKWVRNGGRWALEFDGVDDFVNCGAMNVIGPQTLAAWLWAEPMYSVWLSVPILGNGSCQLGQRGNSVNAGATGFLPYRKWTHVAAAWDGETVRLYVDGTLVNVVVSKEPGSVGRDFLLANPRTMAEGEPPEYNCRFKGKIASVRLYNRPLSHEDVLEDLRTSNITNSPMPMSIPQPGLGRIKVEVDAARLGKPLENVTVMVDVLKAGAAGDKALVSARVKEFDAMGRAVVDIGAPKLPKGEYVVRTTAKDAAGKVLGVPGEEPLSWAGSARFPSGLEGARKLNNLVAELLRVPGPDKSGAMRTFVNPRTGFVFISNRGSKDVKLAAKGSADVMTVSLSQDYDDAYETMRYLPKGKYTITTRLAKDLFVRAVAQTYYDYAHTKRTYVEKFGPYAGEFEERYVFPHYNTFYVIDYDIDKPFVKKWKAKGRRMLADRSVRFKAKEGQSQVDALCEKLAGGLGFSHPMYDGYIVNEFGGFGESNRIWTQALERLLSGPRYKGRVLHAWTFAIYDFVAMRGGEPGREFVRTLQKYDGALQWELYMNSQRTELAAWRHVNDKLVGEALATEQAYPGFVENLIVVPYAYVTAGPPWLTMTLPSYDHRTYLEMQVRTVATDPAFRGVRGLGVYRSPYADEETARWMARLYRHYAIEGNTEPLGKDPFLLTHIRDGDFEEPDKGWWALKSAEEGSMKFGVHHQLGSTQSRYMVRNGDAVLITRRSGKAPNVFSQEIKNLEPGRLYSFRMFSADHKKMRKERHAISIKFDNVTFIPKKCFTHIGGARRKNMKWLNWHVRVFRAKGKTATLTVSDWPGDKPGGPIGQELMYNFIKVQPYFQE